jgi:hypothetical protein
MMLTIVLLGLLCGIVGVLWMRAGRREGEVVHDPAVSTLVFPPESKFQHSVMPRH